MYSAHAKHRVTTAIAGLVIAGSGLLATATVSVADAQPGTGTSTGTVAVPAAGTNAAGSVAVPGGGTNAAGSVAVPAAGTAVAPSHVVPGTNAAGSAAVPSHVVPGTIATGATMTPALIAAEPRGRVTSRLTLSVRELSTSNSRLLGSLSSGSVASLRCKVVGQNVEGNKLWYRLASRPGYVSARYVDNLSPVAYCA